MALLLERIARNGGLANGERISGHSMEAALRLYFHGKITRNQIINLFGIPQGMEADFDQFKTKYDSFLLAVERTDWLLDLEACIVSLQLGDLTKAQFNNFLGLTLTEVVG
jgi:hypothetical protein